MQSKSVSQSVSESGSGPASLALPPTLLAPPGHEAGAVETAPAEKTHHEFAVLIDGPEKIPGLPPQPRLPRGSPDIGQLPLQTLGTLNGRMPQAAIVVLHGRGAARVTAQNAAVLDAAVAPVVDQLRVTGFLTHAIPCVSFHSYLDVPPGVLRARHAAEEVGFLTG